MNIALIYFSGTGNTLYVCNDIKNVFEKHNHKVDIFSFEKQCDYSKYDIIGFGYPIYAFNPPKIFLKMIKRININAPYFIFKSSGETIKINNASSRNIIHVLNKKKCQFLGEYHFAMPYNIIFRFEDEFVKQQLLYEKRLVDILVYNIVNKKNHMLRHNCFHTFIAWLCRLVNVGAKLNSKLYKVDKKKCINCYKCVSSCPFNNIYLDKNKHIKFHSHCQLCMRCSFYCPQNAIKIGFLNNWKVNGDYQLDNVLNNNELHGDYLSKTKKRFYKCYRDYFLEIEKQYKSINL